MDSLNQDLPLLLANLRSGALNLLDYIDQVEQYYEEREPELLAFVPENGRFERLRHQAQYLLDAYSDPEDRPALFGLLVGVKDIFHVDGFTTQAGSQLPSEILQGPQATSVTALLEAGALVMGKTVTTEFAYFGPGPTTNPYNPAHTPGGSSSGSAAAVGANLCPLTFGTQTIGSINRPAAFCGSVGYKPTYDRISRAGVIPLSESLDHIGVFANTVAGAETAVALLCENWQTIEKPTRKPILGIPEGPYLAEMTPEGLTHFRQTCAMMIAAGFTITSVPAMSDFDDIRNHHLALMAAETAAFHHDWYGKYADLYHPRTSELITTGQEITEAQITEAKLAKAALRLKLINLMDANGLDLWISPSATGPAPYGLERTGDPIMNLPWTNSGLPTLTIPSGRAANGLPLGLQLVGRWYEDEQLFAFGAQIEALEGMYV